MDTILMRLNRTDNKDPKIPVVILSLKAYKKITLWTKTAAEINNWEVSGLGTVVPKYGGYYVSDVWLIEPSKVSGGEVEQNPADIHALMQKLFVGTGIPKETKDPNRVSFEGGRDLKNLRLLWHSHGNMGVGWSGTDDRTARVEFCPDAKWTLNIVTNARGHFLARMDFPARNAVLIEKANQRRARTIPDTKIDNLPVRLLIPIHKGQGDLYKQQYLDAHEKFMKHRPSQIELTPEEEALDDLPKIDLGRFLDPPVRKRLPPPPQRFAPDNEHPAQMPDPCPQGDLFEELSGMADPNSEDVDFEELADTAEQEDFEELADAAQPSLFDQGFEYCERLLAAGKSQHEIGKEALAHTHNTQFLEGVRDCLDSEVFDPELIDSE